MPGNPLVRFDEGRGGRTHSVALSPTLPPRDALLAPPLERLAGLTLQEIEEMSKTTPVPRARYQGFLRNVCVAMGNAGEARFRAPLERLAAAGDELVAEHARWALARLLG